jgi:hypothetical protein
MNGLSIFAGVDAEGALKFVGDVPRGAACGCTCAACGAPLVARRGAIRSWHFAHEASQERPDCFAGAVNLLRRLAGQRLRDLGIPPLPVYSTTAATKFPLRVLSESISCEPGPATVELWEAEPGQTGSTALLRLASGTGVRLFVTVGQHAQVRTGDVRAGEGAIFYEVPLPFAAEQLKDLEAAIRHIDENGSFFWRHFPDAAPLKAEALARLEVEAKKPLGQPLSRRETFQPPPREAPAWQYAAIVPPAPAPVVDESPWAAWRKPRHAFLCYGLRDGTGWVLFPHQDGRHVMAPYPSFEGWDEAMPARIGKLLPDLPVYVLSDKLAAMVYLSQMATMVRTASDWPELLALPWPTQ